MTAVHPLLGPTEFFSGAGTVVVTRKVKFIRILSDTVFATLTFQYPQAPAATDAVTPVGLTFPATIFIMDVASFKLASGSIQVIYNHNA